MIIAGIHDLIRIVASSRTTIWVWEVTSSSLSDAEVEHLLMNPPWPFVRVSFDKTHMSLRTLGGDRLEAQIMLAGHPNIKLWLFMGKASSLASLQVVHYEYNDRSDSPELEVPDAFWTMIPDHLRSLLVLVSDDLRGAYLSGSTDFSPRWLARLLLSADQWSPSAGREAITLAVGTIPFDHNSWTPALWQLVGALEKRGTTEGLDRRVVEERTERVLQMPQEEDWETEAARDLVATFGAGGTQVPSQEEHQNRPSLLRRWLRRALQLSPRAKKAARARAQAAIAAERTRRAAAETLAIKSLRREGAERIVSTLPDLERILRARRHVRGPELLRRLGECIDMVLRRGWQDHVASPSEVAMRVGDTYPVPSLEKLRIADDPEVDFDEFADLASLRLPEGYSVSRRISNNSAFKVVYRGRDKQGNPVALKRYKDWESERMQSLAADLGLTRDEILHKDGLAHWLGGLRHRNLVPCGLAVNALGEPFLVEPLLDEIPSVYRIRSLLEIVRLLAGACAGLAYMHEKGVVHSDIKPDNIGILRGDTVLLDFGVSSTVPSKFPSRRNPGSLKTRAPELFGSEVRPTMAADVWSMGATLLAFASGGDYPFLTSGDVSALPPAGESARMEIERCVVAEIQECWRDSNRLRSRTRLAVHPSLSSTVPVIWACCALDPSMRPTAQQLHHQILALVSE